MWFWPLQNTSEASCRVWWMFCPSKSTGPGIPGSHKWQVKCSLAESRPPFIRKLDAMKCLSIFVALGVLGSVVANGQHIRPWELVLRADPLDGLCEIVSLRSAQIHKDLAHQDIVKEVTPIPALPGHPGPSQSVVRTLSHNIHALVSQTQLYCSNNLSLSLPILEPPLTQVPFSQNGASHVHVLDTDLPRLELIPLITSGPAENRVDLAFFADGCT